MGCPARHHARHAKIPSGHDSQRPWLFPFERRVAALTRKCGIKALHLFRLGLFEQLLRQRPSLGDQIRIKSMIDNGRKAIGLERTTKLLAKRVGIAAATYS